jgi:hypothetical protein
MVDASRAGRPIAGAVLAVQCAIASADAVCVAYLGKRAAADSHEVAADLAANCPAAGARAKADQLRRILELKNAAEYDDRELTKSEFTALIERTDRFHRWAVDAVVRAP